MTTTPQAAFSIPRLRAELAGQVIAPDNPEYERARLVLLPQLDPGCRSCPSAQSPRSRRPIGQACMRA